MRKITIAAPVALFALAFAALPASAAASTDSTTCVLTGVAGTASPSEPGENTGVENALQEVKERAGLAPNPGDLDNATSDEGTYSFSGGANCVFAGGPDDGTNVADNNAGLDVGSVHVAINSPGSYVNTFCGTGTATADTGQTTVKLDAATDGIPAAPANGFSDTGAAGAPTYDIPFTIGTGPIYIHKFTIAAGHTFTGGSPYPPPTPDTRIPAGIIAIAPTTGNCITPPDVTAFTVGGSFTVMANDS